jgi:hypothetical protein
MITSTHKGINVSIIANKVNILINNVSYKNLYIRTSFGSFSPMYILARVIKWMHSSIGLDCKAVARIPEK